MRTRDLPCVKELRQYYTKKEMAIICKEVSIVRKHYKKHPQLNDFGPIENARNLATAFDWDFTPQGYDYWHRIYLDQKLRAFLREPPNIN